jgi:DNA-binding NarL/FixJ family response regulator
MTPGTNPSRINVLIADDHPVVRTGIRGMLSDQVDFEIVGEAADGTEAIHLVNLLQPEVVLMDLRMPGVDGVAATRAITQANPSCRVLILTTYDTDADIVTAIEAGATGFLLKDAPRAELCQAIRAAANGDALLASTVASRLMNHVRAPRSSSLSARERAVLQLVARGMTNREAGHELHISEATIKTHLVHIFRKLDVDDRTAAVTVAVEQGLIQIGRA